MSTITFDTLDATRRRRDAGFDEKQAETVVRVLSDAQGDLVTKSYLDAKLVPILTDLALLKWMLGILMAGVLSLVLKTFF